MRRLLVSLLALCSLPCFGQAKINGRVRMAGRTSAGSINSTPPMGWNSFYWMYENVYPASGWVPTESFIKQQSDALVSSGLAALGYRTVGIDGGWMNRDGSNNLQGIPAQFPDGIAALAAYVHADGLLFGLYGTPGDPCLVGTVDQFGFETRDAVTIAGWGTDFWKYDLCSATDQWGSTNADIQLAYQTFGTAMQATGRNIGYLVNAYGAYNSIQWFQTVGANSVRIGNDNSNVTWYSKALTFNFAAVSAYQNKGRWFDPDYLMGGLKEGDGGVSTGGTPVSDTEARAQFNWYAVLAAPLVIGTRVDMLDSSLLQTYSNSEVIAVDQDPLGKMGALIDTTTCGSTSCQVWVRPTTTGFAIALINYDASAGHTVNVNWSDFGQSGTGAIRDMWAHTNLTPSSVGYSVALPAWGSAMIGVTGLTPATATTYINTVFNEAGSGNLAGTTPATCSNGCVGPWTLSGGTDFTYQGGGGILSSTVNSNYDLINSGQTTETVRFNVSSIGSGSFGQIVLRYTDANNFLVVNICNGIADCLGATTGYALFDVVGGTATGIGTGVSTTSTGNYTVVLNGTAVTVTGPSGNVSGTTANTGTKIGVAFRNGASFGLGSLSAKSN